MSFIETSFRDMACKSKGVGIPFIFQHGLASDSDQTQGLLSGIEGVQLISTDSPGHGDHPLPPGMEASFDLFADHVIQTMDRLEKDTFVVGGISMGSGIALNVALRFPDRVRGLVLVRPAWLDSAYPTNLGILTLAAPYVHVPGGKEMFSGLAEFQDLARELPAAAESVLGVFGPAQRAELPRVLREMVADRPFTKLDQLTYIDKPCLVIGNDEDPLHPFSMTRSIHGSIKGSSLKKVTSRYRDPHEHQREVMKHVSEFMLRI